MDTLLGGGAESKAITEIYGEYRQAAGAPDGAVVQLTMHAPVVMVWQHVRSKDRGERRVIEVNMQGLQAMVLLGGMVGLGKA